MPASGAFGVSSPVNFQYFAQADGSESSSGPQSLTSASTLESKLDSPSGGAAKGLLRTTEPFFDARPDAADEQDIKQMQKEDPLGTQIWRLYSKNKSQLPNAERMENLTWRMMSMNLRRKELAARQRSVEASDIRKQTQQSTNLSFTARHRRNQSSSPTHRVGLRNFAMRPLHVRREKNQ